MSGDCSTCRHHSKDSQLRVLGTAEDVIGEPMGDKFVVDDDKQTVYVCRAQTGPHAGRVVGTQPVSCPSYSEGRKGATVDLDALMERLHARSARG